MSVFALLVRAATDARAMSLVSRLENAARDRLAFESAYLKLGCIPSGMIADMGFDPGNLRRSFAQRWREAAFAAGEPDAGPQPQSMVAGSSSVGGAPVRRQALTAGTVEACSC